MGVAKGSSISLEIPNLGARLRGRTATHCSKKGSEKGSGEGFSGRGACCGFYSKQGF